MGDVDLTSVEAFARLSAALADPFADPASVLGAAGIDASRWRLIIDTWARRLAADSGEARELVGRFQRAYEEARAGQPVTKPEAAEQPGGGRFLGAVAQSWRAEAAAVPLTVGGEPPPLAASPAQNLAQPIPLSTPWRGAAAPADDDEPGAIDQTAEIRIHAIGPALPFVAGHGAVALALEPTADGDALEPGAERPTRGPTPAPRAPDADGDDARDMTMEVRVHVPRPALPFGRGGRGEAAKAEAGPADSNDRAPTQLPAKK